MNITEHAERLARANEQHTAQALAFSRAAARSFERLTRQNYAVVGDLLDFTIAQMRIPTAQADARAMVEAQAAQTRALADKTRSRVGEYVEIATELGQLATQAGRPVAPAPHAPTTAPVKAEKAGGTPIVLPDDAAPVVAAKTRRAAAKKPVAKQAAASVATKPAGKKAAAKRAPAKRRAS